MRVDRRDSEYIEPGSVGRTGPFVPLPRQIPHAARGGRDHGPVGHTIWNFLLRLHNPPERGYPTGFLHLSPPPTIPPPLPSLLSSAAPAPAHPPPFIDEHNTTQTRPPTTPGRSQSRVDSRDVFSGTARHGGLANPMAPTPVARASGRRDGAYCSGLGVPSISTSTYAPFHFLCLASANSPGGSSRSPS